MHVLKGWLDETMEIDIKSLKRENLPNPSYMPAMGYQILSHLEQPRPWGGAYTLPGTHPT